MEIFSQIEAKIERSRVDLIGVTEHSEPFVSDKVILRTLREHNTVLTCTKRDIIRHDAELEAAYRESNLLRESFEAAEQKFKQQYKEIAEVKQRLIDAENNIAILKDKMLVLNNVQDMVSGQSCQIVELQKSTDALNSRFSSRMKSNEHLLSQVEVRLRIVEETTSRLENRVDRLKEELLIPAKNVILPLELQAGADDLTGGGTFQLSNLLTSFQDKLENQEATLNLQRHMLQESAEVIAGKAPVHLEDTVRKHASHLDSLQASIDADADCNLPCMLASLREAETDIINILKRLKCKVSYDDVDVKIEARFSEILLYLQTTLHTTEDDDDHVRRETSELRRGLNEMRMTKADRGDLAQLTAQIGSRSDDMSFKVELEERPKRTEILHLLTTKVSFADLNRSLRNLDLPKPLHLLHEHTALEKNKANILCTEPEHMKHAKQRQRHLHVPMPDKACAATVGYGDFRKARSASLDDSARQCLSCETPLTSHGADAPPGANTTVMPAPLGTPVFKQPALWDNNQPGARPLFISSIPPVSQRKGEG